MDGEVTADRDYYQVLGVSRDTSKDAIRRAFRKLAFKYHPDRNPGDPEAERRFRDAAEAYEVLGDENKRALYDRYGMAGLKAGARPRHFASFEEIFSAFSDVFGGGLFGEFFGREGAEPGASLRVDLSISFEEAAEGTTRKIELHREEFCRACRGTGARDGKAFAACRACGGRGTLARTMGFFTMSTTCGRCGGSGRVIESPCPKCRGEATVEESVEIPIDIPAGIEDGTRIRIAGEGEAAVPGGPRGDRYCYVEVEEHPLFRRERDDLLCEVPITFPQAALGAEVEVPTLNGSADLSVPAGTQSGEVFRLRKRGLPNVRTGRKGDLLVRVTVEVPKRLTAREKELLRELATLERTEVTPRRKGFLERLKEYVGTRRKKDA